MFGPFERAVAGRYLRARRGERFVSVIAGFSLVGIALGVGTLIIVMSVMGGFKTDLPMSPRSAPFPVSSPRSPSWTARCC
jgi:ABC-type lipoprotein release transport system permease subunit